MKINDYFGSTFLASLITTSAVSFGSLLAASLESSDAEYPAALDQILRQGDFDTSQTLAPLTADQVRQQLGMSNDYLNYRSETNLSKLQECINHLMDQHKVKIGPNQIEFKATVDLASCAADDQNTKVQEYVTELHLIMACSDGNFSSLQGMGIHQAYQVVNSDETFCAPGTTGWRLGRSESRRQYTQLTDIGTIEVQVQNLVVDSMPDGKPCKTQQDQQHVSYEDGCQTMSKTSFQRATLNGLPTDKQGKQDLAVRVSHGIRALKGKHPWFDSGFFDVILNKQWRGSVTYSGAENPPQFELQSPGSLSVKGVVGELVTNEQ
ncbi:MAG: hypothetical protein NTY08_16230 [Proteobacteria bacterium]|nr:hypothetical protein [Pseudomonadota bacterium]